MSNNFEGKISFLKKVFGEGKYFSSTKEFLVFCCFCSHHKQKLSINLESDAYQCWVCHERGRGLYKVLKKAGSSADIDEYLLKHKSKQIYSPRPDFVDQDFRIFLPKDFNPLVNCKDSFEGKRAWNYLVKTRGIEEEDILKYKIGIANGNFIFPSFDRRGYLNFYEERTPSGFYIKKNVPRGYVGQIIFNELNLDFSKPMILTEGFVDMLKSIPNTAPLLTNNLSKNSKLFEMIVGYKTPVYLALDADAQVDSDRIARNFIRYGVPVYNISVKPFKDLGELTKKEFLYRFESATMTSEDSIFRNKLRALCS